MLRPATHFKTIFKPFYILIYVQIFIFHSFILIYVQILGQIFYLTRIIVIYSVLTGEHVRLHSKLFKILVRNFWDSKLLKDILISIEYYNLSGAHSGLTENVRLLGFKIVLSKDKECFTIFQKFINVVNRKTNTIHIKLKNVKCLNWVNILTVEI